MFENIKPNFKEIENFKMYIKSIVNFCEDPKNFQGEVYIYETISSKSDTVKLNAYNYKLEMKDFFLDLKKDQKNIILLNEIVNMKKLCSCDKSHTFYFLTAAYTWLNNEHCFSGWIDYCPKCKQVLKFLPHVVSLFRSREKILDLNTLQIQEKKSFVNTKRGHKKEFEIDFHTLEREFN
ncbi:hypothetical protein [Candidatus Uabimicrobium sp. HlEnr_7]|uniref:hypothetical protein n=1 Tax=Candidatus Uabimicrobium helgolandensis TaxID=3095367 RepID=UPI0035562298